MCHEVKRLKIVAEGCITFWTKVLEAANCLVDEFWIKQKCWGNEKGKFDLQLLNEEYIFIVRLR